MLFTFHVRPPPKNLLRAFLFPVKQYVFLQFRRQDQRSEIDRQALEELDEGNAEELAAEGQRLQNRAVEGVVRVIPFEIRRLNIGQKAR